jgi:hypothetical protein
MTATTINAFTDIDNSVQDDENTNNTNLCGIIAALHAIAIVKSIKDERWLNRCRPPGWDMPSGLGERSLKAYPDIKVGEDFKGYQK